MSLPIFNKEHLYRRRKQFINNAYNQVSYIQKDCKPFLYLIQTQNYTPIFVNKTLPFVGNAPQQIVPFLEHDQYLKVVAHPKGKFAIFPAGDFELFEKDSQERIATPVLEPTKMIVVCQRYYVMESNLYFSIENIVKTLPLLNHHEKKSI